MNVDAPHTDKAAEALLLDHMDCNLGFYRDRERVVRAVLDAVGYDALVAERDRLRLECDGWRKQRDAADRIHSDTMRDWAGTMAERDRYRQALERVAAMYAPGAFGIQPSVHDAVEVARATLDGDA